MSRCTALRAKWLWRFPNETFALWHKVIKSIYGLDANGWDVKAGVRGSSRSPWRDISRGLSVFLQGCAFKVGNGARIRFWEDEWCRGGGVLKEMFPRLFNLSEKKNITISSFADGEGHIPNWDFGFRRNLSEAEAVEVGGLLEVLGDFRLVPSKVDSRVWKLHPSGSFSCQSFGQQLQEVVNGDAFPPYKQIWKVCSPTKVKIFAWQAALGRVSTADLVQRHRPFICISPHCCVFCKEAGETTDHILLHCPFALMLWGKLLEVARLQWVTPRSCFELFSIKFDAFGKGLKARILWGSLMQALVWNLWLERNRRIFENDKSLGV